MGVKDGMPEVLLPALRDLAYARIHLGGDPVELRAIEAALGTCLKCKDNTEGGGYECALPPPALIGGRDRTSALGRRCHHARAR